MMFKYSTITDNGHNLGYDISDSSDIMNNAQLRWRSIDDYYVYYDDHYYIEPNTPEDPQYDPWSETVFKQENTHQF